MQSLKNLAWPVLTWKGRLAVLHRAEFGAVEHAVACLSNLALKHPRSRAALVQCGGMQALVKVLNVASSPSMLEKVSSVGCVMVA